MLKHVCYKYLIKSLYDVFSFGPYYGEICDSNNLSDGCDNYDFYNSTMDGKFIYRSNDRYNQHAGGDLRFRFGVTNRIDDVPNSSGTPNQTFQPLYIGDNTRFLSNKSS